MITWITGKSNSGKTTLAKQIQENHKNTIILETDNMRDILMMQDYHQFIYNMAHLADILSKQGFDVVVTAILHGESKETITQICNPEWIEL